MDVGFTGTQQGMTQKQATTFARALRELHELHGGVTSFHHGDCVGADAQAHAVARELGFHVVVHPPAVPDKRAWKQGDESRTPLPYLERNKQICAETDILVATPKGMIEELRSGTWSTIRYARRRDQVVLLVYPDGSVLTLNG